MAKRGGYIKLYRALATSPLWTKEPFTRGQAWADLLLLANYAPGHLRVRGNRIEIARGQVGWSAESLSERWMWSRKKVARFLNELEKEQQIAQHKSFVSSVLTIINYEKYQKRVTAKSTAAAQQRNSSGTADDPADDPAEGALKKKKVKKKKEEGTKEERREIAPLVLPEVLDCDLFREALTHWLAYKAERRESYKPAGLSAVISAAAKRAEAFGVQAVVDAMEKASSNGWKGWDQESSFAKSTGRRSPDDPRGNLAARNSFLEAFDNGK